MTAAAFFAESGPPPPAPARLVPLAPHAFAGLADAGLAALVAGHASAADRAPPAVGWPGPAHLMQLGLRARVWSLEAPEGAPAGLPRAALEALARAAAGVRLTGRAALYRLDCAAGTRPLTCPVALLPLAAGSGEQGEVVQVLAAVGV
jgi:hypothetical protein